jgi:hypothetical protein
MKGLSIAFALMVTAAAGSRDDLMADMPRAATSAYVISLPYDFSGVSEETLFYLIASKDRWITLSAFDALRGQWKVQLKDAAGTEKNETEELDQGVKTLIALLNNETDNSGAVNAAEVLAYTPPNRAHHTVIAGQLVAKVANSKNVRTRVWCANALRDFFWARGEALSAEAVKVFEKLMSECQDTDKLYYLLWGMINMGADCLPFKATLEKLQDSSDSKVSGMAKTLLAGMGQKVDGAYRKKVAFLPTPN